MKIVNYITAEAADLKQLDKVVAQLLQRGFQPYGSPYTFRRKSEMGAEGGLFTVAQAMVEFEGQSQPAVK